MTWPIGGRCQTAQTRDALVSLHLVSPDEASAQCIVMGLSPLYAYKLAHERGLIERRGKYWGRLQDKNGCPNHAIVATQEGLT